MQLTSIASGSSGNCIYVGEEKSHLLIDAGISGKRVEQALGELQVNPEELEGILVTHEHVDHIKGIGVLARKYRLPLYMTEKTGEYIKEHQCIGKMDDSLIQYILPEQEFRVGEFTICPHRIWHDAADPVCYTVTTDTACASIATDLGDYDEWLAERLSGCDILFVEANHDEKMLEVGPYPYQLKQRILGQYGHLSNEKSGQLIARLYSDRLRNVFLGHLSKDNNYPELAYETVKLELQHDNPQILEQVSVQVARRDALSGLVTIHN
ncbi:MAG: MBL fold metallo-hydrolase [Lachnospiraceae bacterium]